MKILIQSLVEIQMFLVLLTHLIDLNVDFVRPAGRLHCTHKVECLVKQILKLAWNDLLL